MIVGRRPRYRRLSFLWGQRSKITCARRPTGRKGHAQLVLAPHRTEVTERGRRRVVGALLTGAVLWSSPGRPGCSTGPCWPATPGPPTTSTRPPSPLPTPGWPSCWSRRPGPCAPGGPRRCCGCWPPAAPAGSCSPRTCSTTSSTASGSPASGACSSWSATWPPGPGRSPCSPGPGRAGPAAGRRLSTAVDPLATPDRPVAGRDYPADQPSSASSSPTRPPACATWSA